MKSKSHILLASAAIFFGLMTIRTGGLFLFTEDGQVAAGDYVPFVLWFNFVAGFVYTATGIGIFLKKPWSYKAAKALAALTSIVFVGFGVHVLLEGPYELRTFGAMIFRISFWVIISVALARTTFKQL